MLSWRAGCAPQEGDEGGMCHWLLPAQLMLPWPGLSPLLLGDLCLNPEGKGTGDQLQVLQPQGLLISSKKSSSFPGRFFNEWAF